MALVQPIKNGGPYTKKEQEERRLDVYHLCFEENYSAVKIAEMLNVNRNTINEDIKFWNKQFTRDIKIYDLVSKMKTQIQKMEIQRSRLLEDLESTETFIEKITVEKFINEIDNKLIQIYSKMITQGKNSLDFVIKYEIEENEIKEFVKELILSDEDPDSEDVYNLKDLQFNFIKKTKCDLNHAEKVIEKMTSDGLNLCEKLDFDIHLSGMDNSPKYFLSKFAILRGYISEDEIIRIEQKRAKKKNLIEKEEERVNKIEEEEEKEREDKFIKKYGKKSKWSVEISNKFYNSDEEP